MNKNIATIQQQAQDDAYQIARDSITSNALTVLITLSIVGIGIFFLGKKVTQFIAKNIIPDLKSYLSTQENFIKAINSNSEEIKKNLITLEHDTSSDHIRIIDKLNEIELDVKEIKIIISES
ncbi:MAG: hypothetical protein ACYTXT_33710 [Nostoc sp.]